MWPSIGIPAASITKRERSLSGEVRGPAPRRKQAKVDVGREANREDLFFGFQVRKSGDNWPKSFDLNGARPPLAAAISSAEEAALNAKAATVKVEKLLESARLGIGSKIISTSDFVPERLDGRPQRRRMPVLQTWANERVIYERLPGSSTPSICAVDLGCPAGAPALVARRCGRPARGISNVKKEEVKKESHQEPGIEFVSPSLVPMASVDPARYSSAVGSAARSTCDMTGAPCPSSLEQKNHELRNMIFVRDKELTDRDTQIRNLQEMLRDIRRQQAPSCPDASLTVTTPSKLVPTVIGATSISVVDRVCAGVAPSLIKRLWPEDVGAGGSDKQRPRPALRSAFRHKTKLSEACSPATTPTPGAAGSQHAPHVRAQDNKIAKRPSVVFADEIRTETAIQNFCEQAETLWYQSCPVECDRCDRVLQWGAEGTFVGSPGQSRFTQSKILCSACVSDKLYTEVGAWLVVALAARGEPGDRSSSERCVGVANGPIAGLLGALENVGPHSGKDQLVALLGEDAEDPDVRAAVLKKAKARVSQLFGCGKPLDLEEAEDTAMAELTREEE